MINKAIVFFFFNIYFLFSSSLNQLIFLILQYITKSRAVNSWSFDRISIVSWYKLQTSGTPLYPRLSNRYTRKSNYKVKPKPFYSIPKFGRNYSLILNIGSLSPDCKTRVLATLLISYTDSKREVRLKIIERIEIVSSLFQLFKPNQTGLFHFFLGHNMATKSTRNNYELAL